MTMTTTDLTRAIESSIATEPEQWTITEGTAAGVKTSMFGDVTATPGTPAKMTHMKAGIVVTLDDVPARVGVALKSVAVPLAAGDSARLAAAIEQFMIGRAIGLLFTRPDAPKDARIDGADVVRVYLNAPSIGNFVLFGADFTDTPKAESLAPPSKDGVTHGGRSFMRFEPIPARHANNTLAKDGSYKGCHCKDCQGKRKGGANGK